MEKEKNFYQAILKLEYAFYFISTGTQSTYHMKNDHCETLTLDFY